MTKIDYTLPLDQLPDPLPIEPLTKPFDVTITPPGSKSITCRAYVLAALANGESKIIRPLRADDTDLLLKALCTLGAEARWEGEDVFIKGVNGRFPRGGSVNLGDGGTPTRFMIACACLAAEPVVVDGSPRMRERPIAEGVDMLRQMGAKIEYVEAEGRLPVRVVPSEHFLGGQIDVQETLSSQSVSALLLIGMMLPHGVRVRFLNRPTSQSYLRLTVSMLERLDVSIEASETDNKVNVGQIPRHQWHEASRHADVAYDSIRVTPSSLNIESIAVAPDSSSCAYWWVVSAARPRSVVWIPDDGLGHSDPDRGIFLLLHSLGCEVVGRQVVVNEETEGRLSLLAKARLEPRANCFDFSDMPDGSLAFSILCSTFPKPTHLTGLRTLRVKETDRIAALANELRKVGCTIETGDDWITIDPSTRHNDPVIIEPYNDHRMAMSFAILGLVRPGGGLSIRNPKCVAKSYPGFWKDFAKLYGPGIKA